MESFLRGYWIAACNLTSRLLTVVIRRRGASLATSFVTNLQRMPTTVLRERCSRSAAAGATVKATSIVPRKRSVQTARKRNVARLDPIADYLCTSKNPSGKPSAPWPERQLTSVRGGLATKSKLCLLNSSSECAYIECDYAACGMSASSFCWPPPPKI